MNTYQIDKTHIDEIRKLPDCFSNLNNKTELIESVNEIIESCHRYNSKVGSLLSEGAETIKHRRREMVLGSPNEKGTFMNLISLIVDGIPGLEEQAYIEIPESKKEILIDTHVHMKPTREMPYSGPWIELGIDSAQKRGLDGIVLVEHYYSRGTSILNDVQNLPVRDNFFIFPGIELNVYKEGKYEGHVILVSNYESLQQFIEEIEKMPKQTPPNLNDLFVTANRFGRDNYAIIGAHVFDRNWLLCHPERIESKSDIPLSSFDAIDHKPGSFKYNIETRKAAEKYRIPILTCSDAHVPFAIGNWASSFKKPEGEFTVDEFISQIRTNRSLITLSGEGHYDFIPKSAQNIIDTADPNIIEQEVQLTNKIREFIVYLGMYEHKKTPHH